MRTALLAAGALSLALALGRATVAQTATATGTPAAAPLSAAEQNTVALLERTLAGVVFIAVTAEGQQASPFASPLYDDPGANPQQQSSGSGFFVNAQGYALTNYHVVEGASSLTVRLRGDERRFPARVVGVAPDYDLALIQAQNVPANLYRPLTMGNSEGLRVGQRVFALGAPFGLEFSASEGIVSAVGRTIPTGVRQIPQAAVQTDAAINPGNSGGPLLNSSGQVIGINTQILSPAGASTGVGQSAGVGFAIPSNVARGLLPRLQAGGVVSGPVIGVALAPFPLTAFSEEFRARYNLPTQGALVSSVVQGSPAAAAGIRGGTEPLDTPIGQIRLGGDVITAVAGRPVRSPEDLQGLIFNRQPGERVPMTLRRNGQQLTVTVTLGTASTATPSR